MCNFEFTLSPEIVAAVIGGFLAAGSGWLLQNRQEAGRIKKIKELWLLTIKEDLTSSVDLYKQIADGWVQSKLVWFNLMNELDDSRSGFYRNRDYAAFLDVELRTKTLKYYRVSANILNQIKNTQQRKYDLQAKLRATHQETIYNNPKLDEEKIAQIVLTASTHDTAELKSIEQSLPQLVNSLEAIKNDAREILTILNYMRV